jgi:hypothetical protein
MRERQGIVGVDRPVVARQHRVGQLRDLPDERDTGRAGPDHHKGQPLGPLGPVRRHLGHLELRQDAVAQVPRVLHGLHPRSELGELVLAEVGVSAAGGNHQRVVGQVDGPPVRAVGAYHLRVEVEVEVEVVHVGQECAGDLLLLDHALQCWRDQPGGQDARGHLVKQRLEQVVRPIHHRHVPVRLPRTLRTPLPCADSRRGEPQAQRPRPGHPTEHAEPARRAGGPGAVLRRGPQPVPVDRRLGPGWNGGAGRGICGRCARRLVRASRGPRPRAAGFRRTAARRG